MALIFFLIKFTLVPWIERAGKVEMVVFRASETVLKSAWFLSSAADFSIEDW
jgi:hypothetical protein